ncbi:MAG: site-specific integrase [Oscillospiraceae bacterium]|jgi:integrase|nr:site-specific integrase [Oscillospiraceae bacterium]
MTTISPTTADIKTHSFSDIVDEWLNLSARRLKPSTSAAYTTLAERHIKPYFGDLEPYELTEELLSEFREDKAAEGLGASALRSLLCVLRSVISYGARYGFALPADSCRLSASSRPPVEGLRADEQLKILLALGDAPEGLPLGVLIGLYAGLRVGEICGLKWGDVSKDCTALAVSRSVSRIRRFDEEETHTEIIIGEPKSAFSKRRVPVPQRLTQALQASRGRDEWWLLTNSREKTPEPRALQRFFTRLLDECGVRHVGFHALRHSFATRCVELDFDVKALSLLLGHADVRTTLNTYVHPSYERMASLMHRLD